MKTALLVGAFVIVVMVVVRIILWVMGRKFDKDWEKMSPDERRRTQEAAYRIHAGGK